MHQVTLALAHYQSPFTASVNIATLVVVFTPVIVSVTALIKGLLKRKGAKASAEEEKPQE